MNLRSLIAKLQVVALTAAGLVSVLLGSPTPVDATGIVIAVRAEPDTLDPHATGSRRAYAVMKNLFDTLVYRDADGKFHPALAEAWEHSADGKTYRFRLRRDVKFHDGTPFNADAVVFNLNRVVDPTTKSRTAVQLLGPYAGSRAVDASTVEVTFKSTVSPSGLLDALSQAWLGMVSPAAVQAAPAELGRKPVGTGPFRFKEWRAQSQVVLERNAGYAWASPAFRHKGPPALTDVTFRIVPEDATRVASLERGEVDLVQEVAIDALEKLRADRAFQVVSGVAPGGPVIFWMNTETEPLSDIRVRRAILHGFNRQALLRGVYRGQVVAAEGPLSPTTWAYTKRVEGLYPYDLARARALLDEAGWTPGADGVRTKGGKPLAIRLGDLFDRRRGEFFQASMRQLGIQVEFRLVSSAELFGMTRKAGDYEMASTWYASSDPHILNLLFNSANVGTGFAISRWKDPALDAKLAQAFATIDDARRAALYEEIQLYIMDKALLVPVHSETELDVIKARFKGYRLDRGQYPELYEVTAE
jgi:peptide/nickel transport system substrate-binding protein